MNVRFFMSLHTFYVPFSIGQVVYATVTSNSIKLTVECFNDKKAYTFEYVGNQDIRINDWIKFRGHVRIDPSIKKNGEFAETFLYYHDPRDNTKRSEWIHFTLLSAEVFLIGPPDLAEALHATNLKIRRLEESWSHNFSTQNIKETIESINGIRDLLTEYMNLLIQKESDMNAPIRLVSLDDV